MNKEINTSPITEAEGITGEVWTVEMSCGGGKWARAGLARWYEDPADAVSAMGELSYCDVLESYRVVSDRGRVLPQDDFTTRPEVSAEIREVDRYITDMNGINKSPDGYWVRSFDYDVLVEAHKGALELIANLRGTVEELTQSLTARDELLRDIQKWFNDKRMAQPETKEGCALVGCTLPMPHDHTVDGPYVTDYPQNGEKSNADLRASGEWLADRSHEHLECRGRAYQQVRVPARLFPNGRRCAGSARGVH